MTASSTEDRRKRPALGRGLAALFGDAGGRLMTEPGAPRSVPIEDAVDTSGADFELVAGERRWRAAQRAGLHRVPVIVRPLGDLEALEIALVENLQREDLSALEEAEAYSRLMREFGRSQTDLAEAFGKSR